MLANASMIVYKVAYVLVVSGMARLGTVRSGLARRGVARFSKGEFSVNQKHKRS